jgi:prevent-host-death family protein
MRTHPISEVKNRLSELLDHVRAGETIVVTDRGVPVARIEPAIASEDPAGRLRRLERAGLLRVGKVAAPVDLLREPGPALPSGVSAVEAVLEERRAGR